MAKETTTSIKIINNQVSVVRSTYNKGPGRKNLDYSTLHGLAFQNSLNSKIDTFKTYNKRLDDYDANNTFNVFITLSAVTPKHKGNLLDKLRKIDKSSSYACVCLAAWTLTSDLHYHIMLNTTADLTAIRKALNKCNAKVKEIYDQPGLVEYFKKNINYDTIWVLRQTENTRLDVDLDELREKQLEILNCVGTLTTSTNIGKTKVIKIPNVSKAQVKEVENICEHEESFEYKKNGSDIKIDKFATNDVESVIAAIATADTKVEESTTSSITVAKAAATITTPKATAPAGSHSFIDKILINKSSNANKAENSHKINIDNIFKKKEWQLC